MVEEGIGRKSCGKAAVGNPDIAHILTEFTGESLAYDCRGALVKGHADVAVAVALETLYRNEKRSRSNLPGIQAHIAYFRCGISAEFKYVKRRYYLFKFHLSTSLTVSPAARVLPAAGVWLLTWPEPS